MTSSMPWKRAPSCATGPLSRKDSFYLQGLCLIRQCVVAIRKWFTMARGNIFGLRAVSKQTECSETLSRRRRTFASFSGRLDIVAVSRRNVEGTRQCRRESTMADVASAIGIRTRRSVSCGRAQGWLGGGVSAQLIAQYHQPIYSLIARSLNDPSGRGRTLPKKSLSRYFAAFAASMATRVCARGYTGLRSMRRRTSGRWWSRHKRQEITIDAPTECEDTGENFSLASTLAGPAVILHLSKRRKVSSRVRVEALRCGSCRRSSGPWLSCARSKPFRMRRLQKFWT